MKVKCLTSKLAKKLGMIAVAGGMSLGMAVDGFAAPVTVGDPGFEDHVIDDGSGYAYGAAAQAGDADGFNNPSSANQGVSPWFGLGGNGNGLNGSTAPFMVTSGYSVVNSGTQAIEVQGLIAQPLADVFQALDYTVTVAATDQGGSGTFRVGLYDAGEIALATGDAAQTDIAFLALSSLVQSPDLAAGAGAYADVSHTFTAAELAGLTGQNIGIAIWESNDASGQGPVIDDVRLDVVPEPASIALLGLGGVAIASMRRRK